MVRGIEDLRTPLSRIIALDKELRGKLSGFMMPAFVIDLPGGGGKRLVSTVESYENGVAVYSAPGLPGIKGQQKYVYHDPIDVADAAVEELRKEHGQALEQELSSQELASSVIPRPGPLPMPLSGNLQQPPPLSYERDLPRASIAASGRQPALKPQDLAPHISVGTWRPTAAAL